MDIEKNKGNKQEQNKKQEKPKQKTEETKTPVDIVPEKQDKAIKQKQTNKPTKEKKKRKPYIHIDTFLQTAKVMYDMTNVQVAGFKGRMNGRHYQRGEEVFTIELEKYLNKK